MASTFDAFLAQCWADHAEHPHDVARRLTSREASPPDSAALAALLRLELHVRAEHLGDFEGARAGLRRWANDPLVDDAVRSALRVGRYSLALAEPSGGDVAPGLSLEETLRAEASAAAIRLGRADTPGALALLRTAQARLAALPQGAGAVHRPLAVACNNLAWSLHDAGSARSAADTAAMLELAAASRVHWAEAGTWLEVQRADYGLALCHLSAGRPADALPLAERCLASCRENAAPAFELFHACEALCRAHAALG
ncbi:MAG: hypothetical protein ABIQ29_05385, partial [Burkholderiaceae bacterium]